MLANRIIASGTLSTLTFVAKQGANANSVTLSASILTGDLIVVLGTAENGGNSCTDNMPGDFTKMYRASGASASQNDWNAIAYAKVAEVTDISRLITVINGDGEGIVVFVFRPDAPITTIAYSTWLEEYQATAQPSAQTVSASGQAVPLVVLGGGATSGVPSFSTETPAFDGTQVSGNNSFQDLIGGYKVYNSAPANHSIRSADNTSKNTLFTGWVTVS